MFHAVTIARHLFVPLLVLLIALPASAAVSSDGTSTQHLGGVGGRLPTVNAQALMGWFFLESDINRAALLVLYTTNDATADAVGFKLNADGTTLEAMIVDAGAISDLASIQTLTVGKWYHLAIVRVDASTFRFHVGDESTASTLRATLTRTIENQAASWGLGLLGAGVPNTSPHARIEHWKHYTDALSVTRIEEERASLTPFRTTDLFSYNPLTASGSYAGTAGSAPYTFTEQGDSKFSTAAGPTVLARTSGAHGPIHATPALLVLEHTLNCLRLRQMQRLIRKPMGAMTAPETSEEIVTSPRATSGRGLRGGAPCSIS